MPGRPPKFQPEVHGLEHRMLLSATREPADARRVFLSTIVSLPYVSVSQQSESATINVERSGSDGTVGPLKVRLVTVPSPSVGVNLPAIDQLVTFAPGESVEHISIPINVGAPNPGAVDVGLTILPVDGGANFSVISGTLHIKASSDVAPPTVVGSRWTKQGIQLTFSEPMDPVGVQDVRKFDVYELQNQRVARSPNSSFLDAITGGILMIGTPFAKKYPGAPKRFAVKAAIYDPTTLTVTLITAEPITSRVVVVSEAFPQVRPSRTRKLLPALTDASQNELDFFSATLVHPTMSPITPGRRRP